MGEQRVAKVFRRVAVRGGGLLWQQARTGCTGNDVVLGLFTRGRRACLYVVGGMLHLYQEANDMGQGHRYAVDGYYGVCGGAFQLILQGSASVFFFLCAGYGGEAYDLFCNF